MRVGHGAKAEMQLAILTPLRATQKQKAAAAAFRLVKRRYYRYLPARGRPWLSSQGGGHDCKAAKAATFML
jgi:hypothetical protein